MDSENNISSTDNLHINTEGGPYVGRDANVGRDFAGRDVITITENHYHVQSETNAENLLNSISSEELFKEANRLQLLGKLSEALEAYIKIKKQFPYYQSASIAKEISILEETLFTEANRLQLGGKLSEACVAYKRLGQISPHYRSNEVAREVATLEFEIGKERRDGYLNIRGEVELKKLITRYTKYLLILVVIFIIISSIIRPDKVLQVIETIKSKLEHLSWPKLSIQTPLPEYLSGTPIPVLAPTPELLRTETPTPISTPEVFATLSSENTLDIASILTSQAQLAPALTSVAQMESIAPALTSQAQMKSFAPALTSQAQLAPALTSQAQMKSLAPALTAAAQIKK